MTEEIGEEIIAINFDIHEPINMVDLSDSLKALAELYKEFVIEQTEDKTVTVKLHITSVSNNCITVTFMSYIAIAGSILTVLECVKISVRFIKWLSNAKKHFKKIADKGSVDELGCPFTKKQMQQLVKMTKIVANKKDSNMSVRLKTRKISADGSIEEAEFNASDNEASDIKKAVKLEYAAIKDGRRIEPPKLKKPAILSAPKLKKPAILSPPKPIITSDGEFIYYRYVAGKSFSAKIERITTTDYDATTQKGNIIGGHGLNRNFTCTQQQYDDIINFIKVKK